MGPNAILVGWNRSIPGLERVAAAHFQEFSQYLGGLQQNGTIQSFEVVLLNPHGGDLNGFFLIRGDPGKLSDLTAGQDWLGHVMRAMLHTEGFGAIAGATGETVMERMRLWTSLLPS